MRKSYIREASLDVDITIELGEINQLIDVLNEVVANNENAWSASQLKRKLEKVRLETIEEARREFENMTS